MRLLKKNNNNNKLINHRGTQIIKKIRWNKYKQYNDVKENHDNEQQVNQHH